MRGQGKKSCKEAYRSRRPGRWRRSIGRRRWARRGKGHRRCRRTRPRRSSRTARRRCPRPLPRTCRHGFSLSNYSWKAEGMDNPEEFHCHPGQLLQPLVQEEESRVVLTRFRGRTGGGRRSQGGWSPPSRSRSRSRPRRRLAVPSRRRPRRLRGRSDTSRGGGRATRRRDHGGSGALPASAPLLSITRSRRLKGAGTMCPDAEYFGWQGSSLLQSVRILLQSSRWRSRSLRRHDLDLYASIYKRLIIFS
jgi:hypothetical protein